MIKPTKESNGAKPPGHTAAFGAMDHHKGTTSTLLYHRQWNRHGTRQPQRFSLQALLCASRSRRLTLRTQPRRLNASYSTRLYLQSIRKHHQLRHQRPRSTRALLQHQPERYPRQHARAAIPKAQPPMALSVTRTPRPQERAAIHIILGLNLICLVLRTPEPSGSMNKG